jgi:hypothetical protein
MGGCQIVHWARTGEFVPKADGDKSTEAPTKTIEDKFDFAYNYGVEEIGVDSDPLILTAAVINHVLREARAT